LGREPGEPEPTGRYVLAVEETDQGVRVRELERTVAAMREALELGDRDAAERVQRAIADAAGETEQLKATIRALRDKLEAQRQEHAAAMQDAERLQRDGLRELQETIRSLRERLEGTAGG
jgi:protein involved in polysaccharide export with SLBB domain